MFSSLLPKPRRSEYVRPALVAKKAAANTGVLMVTDTEFDGGQEVENPSSTAVSKYYVNSDGTLNYSRTIGEVGNQQRFHSSYEDTIPLKQRFPNLKHNFPITRDIDTINDTKQVIERLLAQQMGLDKAPDTEHITYDDKTIQIQNYQQDPMLPPKHKLRKNRIQQPDAPPPILKSANDTKLTKEDHAKWNIPAPISNWKNNQGFTISLDKRLIAASSNETPRVNLSKLADLSTALDQADRQAREDIQKRNLEMKELKQKQQLEKEQKLRELAELSRKRKQNDSHGSYKRYKH